MLDAYLGPSRITTRKPYSFAPYHGDAFLDAFAWARREWIDGLHAGGAPCDAWPALDASPSTATARRRAVDAALEARWRKDVAGGSFDAAVWLERVLRAHAGAGLALAADGASRWSLHLVQRFVERFEAFGCVHTRYDADFHRLERAPNTLAVLVRLAAVTAWCAWTVGDAARAVVFLNALLKIDDLVQATTTHDDVSPAPTDVELAVLATTLESRLLERVRVGAGRLAESGLA